MTEVIQYNEFVCKACSFESKHLVKPGFSAVFCNHCNERIELIWIDVLTSVDISMHANYLKRDLI